MKIEFWTHLRKSIHLFCRKSGHTWENLDRYVYVSQFVFWRKWKCRHTWENLDRYVCLVLRFEENVNLNIHLRKSRRTEIIGGFHRWWWSALNYFEESIYNMSSTLHGSFKYLKTKAGFLDFLVVLFYLIHFFIVLCCSFWNVHKIIPCTLFLFDFADTQWAEILRSRPNVQQTNGPEKLVFYTNVIVWKTFPSGWIRSCLHFLLKTDVSSLDLECLIKVRLHIFFQDIMVLLYSTQDIYAKRWLDFEYQEGFPV